MTASDRLEQIAKGMAAANLVAAFVALPALCTLTPFLAMGSRLESAAAVVVIAAMAGCGFWLLNGYFDVHRGGARPIWFWWASAAFNAAGLLWYGWMMIVLVDGFVAVGVMWTATMGALSL